MKLTRWFLWQFFVRKLGEILHNEYIIFPAKFLFQVFDIPKLFDLCALYGGVSENDRMLEKMLTFVFTRMLVTLALVSLCVPSISFFILAPSLLDSFYMPPTQSIPDSGTEMIHDHTRTLHHSHTDLTQYYTELHSSDIAMTQP